MRRFAALAAVLLTCTRVFADGEIRVRAFVEPEGEIFTGQQVRLNIEVQTDSWFTTAPGYPELSLPGAIALMPDAFGINSTTREGGRTWAGQTRRFVLFPQRSGKLQIPPIEISLAVARDGKAGPLTSVTSPAVVIPVLAPPGSEAITEFVSTRDYRISADWDRDLEDLKVGDAISLTVTQMAEDVFALVVPPVVFPEIDGLARYASRPELRDRNDRGRLAAVRTDRVTYVLQRQGEFTIPGITTFWFDLGDKTMQEKSLETTTIRVAANPDAVLGDGAEPDDRERLQRLARTALDWLIANIHWISIAIAVAYGLMRWGIATASAALARWRERRQAWKYSEQAYFRKLKTALRAGDPDAVIAGFWRWSDRLPGRKIPRSLDGLREAAMNTGFEDAWSNLEQARYRDADAAGQHKAVTRLRKTCRALRDNWFATRPGGSQVAGDEAAPRRLNP